ncbi:hypothetical protein BBK36DRAFT_151548 [Trichoderma citrinoviride]|uniref:HMG box domain-containing protein n=1 Tax=Trichoderma citrinoviride TaxID=58853 RepID=A0A2T4BKR8_9HYPO|nr:hypothetical protein BBK36DRAFT_151548 [Trichoderma citrinoviride]PTB69871.1 hypothetical protein BBK36DRAFT_151548 [Trichoderma citrinoviride]
MLSSAGLGAARRVLTSSGAAAPWHQFSGLAARALVLRLAAPSVRTISLSASMRSPAAKATSASKSTTKKTTKPKSSSTTKKSTAKKAAKPKAKKPAKKAVKKKAAAKKPKAAKKKTLTDEQKERLEIRKLKQMSLLKGPTALPETAWSVYMVDNLRGGTGGDALGDKVKALSTSFKNLPESEKERLAAIGNSNKIANQEAKKKWIESFPPEAIYTANLARRRLARKTDKTKIYLLHDERLPHRTGSGFTLYIKQNFGQSGADSATDAMRTMSERWRSLSPDEKAPYVEEATELNKVSGEKVKALRKKGELYWKEKLASPSPAA